MPENVLSLDETRDDLNQMKSEIQNISEKLNSQMSQRVETAVEGIATISFRH